MKPGFILRKLFYLVLTFYIIITLSFFLVRFAPGSPFSSEKENDTALQAQMERFGYNKPLIQQYFTYLGGLFKGEFGPSSSYEDHTVGEIIADSAPLSFTLGLMALVFAYTAGLAISLVCVYKKETWIDYSLLLFALGGICLPGFVIAQSVLYVLGYKLGIIPTAMDDISFFSLIMPAITLGLPTMAYVVRLGRKSLGDEMHKDYVRTALASGIEPKRILFRQVLKNGFLPLLTFMGPAAAGLMTGSVVIEKVFALPGIGRYFVYGALNRDHFLVLGVALLYSLLLLGFNFLVDIAYRFIDPRIKSEGEGV